MSFNCAQRFDALMGLNALESAFRDRFSTTAGKGIDRLNGFQFAAAHLSELAHASRKCLNGTLRFSPYLEALKIKTRDSKPRLISIPTVRDRVVLHQLKNLLAEAFPDCIPRSIAGSIIRDIAGDLPKHNTKTTYVAGCDIRKFYDTLHRDRLMNLVARRVTDLRALKLIERSIATPTVPASTRRRDHSKYQMTEGIPQGLATSNILASIYLYDIDAGMRTLPVRYFRYVDDVLIYGDEDAVRKAQRSFVARTRRRGLSVHAIGGGKSHLTVNRR